MNPSLGWVQLSREALKRAEAHLQEDSQGILDEMGFLALHRAYADRFFPGTSVLHTRLRYILFIPWMYHDLMHLSEHTRIDAAVTRYELRTAKRLKASKEEGVIGGRSLPNPTSQPPSMAYWSALGAWGLLKPRVDGSFPARSEIHRMFGTVRASHALHDDEHELLNAMHDPFIRVPSIPKAWFDDGKPLSFNLQKSEATFLRAQLSSITCAGHDSKLSLFSELIDKNVFTQHLVSPWSRTVMRAASQDDREALVQARQVAALSAIGRGVYAALVEGLCEDVDGRRVGKKHREQLKIVRNTYKEDAVACDIRAVLEENPSLPSAVIDVLIETKKYLENNNRPQYLLDLYRSAERQRKGNRARLSDTFAGQKRRQDWLPDKYPEAAPLHYRWGTVRRLIADLVGATNA